MKTERFLLLFILMAVVVISGCKKANNSIYYDRNYVQEIKQTREAFSVFMAINSVPGAQIAIYKEGKLIYSEGLGHSSIELKSDVTRETKFRLGNSTGILTSMAYHKLVENGTLHPDSSIYYYLPDFPRKGHNITIENLIQNTSGFREASLREVTDPEYSYSIQQGIELFKDSDLVFTPGDYQTTSVFDYNLLGAIMEKQTGNNFDKIIREFVTDTLQLKNTILDNPYAIIEGRSTFYDVNMYSFTLNAQTIDLRSNAPSLGYLSTSEDLAKFGNAILHSSYVSNEIREKLFKPVTLNMGFPADMTNGWKLLKDRWERNFYGSIGNVTGGYSSLLISPDDDLVIAIMMNTTFLGSNFPDYQIATFFLKKTEDQIEYEKYQNERKQQSDTVSEQF